MLYKQIGMILRERFCLSILSMRAGKLPNVACNGFMELVSDGRD